MLFHRPARHVRCQRVKHGEVSKQRTILDKGSRCRHRFVNKFYLLLQVGLLLDYFVNSRISLRFVCLKSGFSESFDILRLTLQLSFRKRISHSSKLHPKEQKLSWMNCRFVSELKTIVSDTYFSDSSTSLKQSFHELRNFAIGAIPMSARCCALVIPPHSVKLDGTS